MSGGSNTGAGEGDIASVDSIDIPALQQNAIAKAQALAAIKPDRVPPSQPQRSGHHLRHKRLHDRPGPQLGQHRRRCRRLAGTRDFCRLGEQRRGYGEDMVATRYNADGTPDTTFGNNGEADHRFPPRLWLRLSKRRLSSRRGDRLGRQHRRRRQHVLGFRIHRRCHRRPTTTPFAIAKLDRNRPGGTNFGNNGFTTVDLTTDTRAIPFNAVARDVAIQADGNIDIGGDISRRSIRKSTYDPAAEFSPTDNPTNVWSYGYTDHLGDQVNNLRHPHAGRWHRLLDIQRTSKQFDHRAGCPAQRQGDSEDGIQDGTLALDPGFYGEYSHVVFTAPAAGSYDINGTFDVGGRMKAARRPTCMSW